MKFYYNGKLVRTSDHPYTHAVIYTESGAAIACRKDRVSCEKYIQSEISANERGIENARAALKALDEGKSGYWWKRGSLKGFDKFDKSKTTEELRAEFENWVKENTERIAHIRATRIVVELEQR